MDEVFIVGAGVVGMTAAARFLELGVRVRMGSRNDGPVAGRNGVGILERQGQTITIARNKQSASFSSIPWENETFTRFHHWVAEAKPWVRILPVEYHRVDQASELFESPFPGMEAEVLTDSELHHSFTNGVRFKGYIINTRMYYEYLENWVFNHRHFEGITHLDISSPTEVDHPRAIIACGLGQRIWDSEMYSGLGETVVMSAPKVRRDRVVGAILPEISANVLPVPGTECSVIVGASKRDGLDYETPREEWFDRILELGTSICPELADSQEIDRRVGCRPKRVGGTRVEIHESAKQKILVAGGFGGSGWSFSWGGASAFHQMLAA